MGLVCGFAAIALTSCGRGPGLRHDNLATVYLGRPMSGQASWYGPGFHGKRTASGERFNENAYTAAHRSLPFGSRVRVKNLRNGRMVDVRINDRGPFVRGRIIDLSKAAAAEIGMIRDGVVPVEVQVLTVMGD